MQLDDLVLNACQNGQSGCEHSTNTSITPLYER